MDTTLRALSYGPGSCFGVNVDSSRIQRLVPSHVQQGWKDFICLWRASVGHLAREKEWSFPVVQRPQDPRTLIIDGTFERHRHPTQASLQDHGPPCATHKEFPSSGIQQSGHR